MSVATTEAARAESPKKGPEWNVQRIQWSRGPDVMTVAVLTLMKQRSQMNAASFNKEVYEETTRKLTEEFPNIFGTELNAQILREKVVQERINYALYLRMMKCQGDLSDRKIPRVSDTDKESILSEFSKPGYYKSQSKAQQAFNRISTRGYPLREAMEQLESENTDHGNISPPIESQGAATHSSDSNDTQGTTQPSATRTQAVRRASDDTETTKAASNSTKVNALGDIPMPPSVSRLFAQHGLGPHPSNQPATPDNDNSVLAHKRQEPSTLAPPKPNSLISDNMATSGDSSGSNGSNAKRNTPFSNAPSGPAKIFRSRNAPGIRSVSSYHGLDEQVVPRNGEGGSQDAIGDDAITLVQSIAEPYLRDRNIQVAEEVLWRLTEPRLAKHVIMLKRRYPEMVHIRIKRVIKESLRVLNE